MSRTAASLADLAAIAVAAWVLLSDRFDGIGPGNLLDLVAVLVVVTSSVRLWRRHGPRA